MEELDDNIRVENIKDEKDTYFYKIKPKKRSLVERELETNLTERITSPIIINGDNTNISRYGRARRLKKDSDSSDLERARVFKSPLKDKSPIKSPVYKMHASNSPIQVDSQNKTGQSTLDHQIENIYNENISLSRFNDDKKHISPARQSPKVYVRKDLIQTKEKEETVTLIKHYSPNSTQKLNTHLNVLERSCEKYSLNNNKQFGYLNNSSVVKTLDFDGKKKNKDSKGVSKSDVFDMEAKCEYQVGDLAWAKMGTYPYWPCIVTRDPFSGMFVKKKLFGRVDRDMIHVTFFGDNGRRSWIVDNMLRKFLGQLEFETTRDQFTPETKKKDPRCTAFFVSEKKLPQWTVSVEEAETLLREPKRLRIDLLNDMLNKARILKTTPKGSRKITRTDSDVSLSESLYDTLFSEDDSKTSDLERSKSKTRNKSLDVSEVVTACLDNMAAKTGITKIQKQSHMDRWLQKAKSKTPEKSQLKSQRNSHNPKQDMKRVKSKRIKKESDLNMSFKFTMSDNESLNDLDTKLHAHQNEHDYSIHCSSDLDNVDESEVMTIDSDSPGSCFGIISKVESLSDKNVADISNNTEVEEVVISDICTIDEETVVNFDNVLIETNGMNNVVIKNVKTIGNDDATVIDSIISKSCGGDNDISTTISENLTCNSNEVKDDLNVTELTSPITNSSMEIPLSVPEMCNTVRSDSVKEVQLEINLKDGENVTELTSSITNPSMNIPTSVAGMCNTVRSDSVKEVQLEINLKDCENTLTTEIQTYVTNGDDELKDIEFRSKQQTKTDLIIPSTADSTCIVEEMIKNPDNATATDDQQKPDVNIAKTIISDKLIDNNVDFNKVDFNFDMNEIPTDENFIVNDDSNLTIPEPNGHTNSITIDKCNKLNSYADCKSSAYIEKLYEVSEALDDKNSTDSSEYKSTQNVNNKELEYTFNNSPLASSVNNICSDIFYGDNKIADCYKTDCLDNESVTSDKLKSGNNIVEVVTNGFSHNKDDAIEAGSKITCNLYMSSEDDSTNSTATYINEYSSLGKYKTKFVTKNCKHLSLQDALVPKDTESISDVMDPEFVSRVLDKPNKINVNVDEEISTANVKIQNISEESEHCSTDSSYANEDINALDSRSQNTTTEIKRCFTDSNYTHEEISTLGGKRQNNTGENEQCSTDSIYTGDYDNKSLCSEAQTEITEAMDVDDSTFDSLTQNDYQEPIKFNAGSKTVDRNKIILPVNINEEKTIMGGDELRLTPHGLEVIKENVSIVEDIANIVDEVKDDNDVDSASIISNDSDISLNKRKMCWKAEKSSFSDKNSTAMNMEHPEFLKYVELKQDAIYDEHPELSQDEITTYLYNTWLYEESLKTDRKKTDDIESASMIKGLKSEAVKHPKKSRKRVKVEKEKDYEQFKQDQVVTKQKPKRRTVRPSYNEEYTDVEEDLEVYSIPILKDPSAVEIKIEPDTEHVNGDDNAEALEIANEEILDEIDEVEEYFARLTDPKPNVFKGLLREKVCEICEKTSNLVKCKGCSSMFHVDCIKKDIKVIEIQTPGKGRKKKRKYKGRKSNGLDESQSDEKDANVSEELVNTSMENSEPEPYIVANAEDFEAQLAIKMKEMLGDDDNLYNDEFYSGDELDWSDIEAGKCEIVDIKLRKKENESVDYTDFKCNNCQNFDVPICFVCRRAESPKSKALHRQRCQVLQCNKYYHLECLEHWPQTQFNSGESARYNKKINEYFEALTCPRHVCHTCVSDDPRGCKTRFCGDKLARCVRCPATYHTFTKCLPAGSQILSGSHIICPRHHEHRPGKIPCHVNTGWCFICALGGTLICCEYCPTSFHAECLNIKPPEGGYMCEDCETGRLPLYGEMVWVKLGHYRWWPGIILHPCEIPENILAVKHSPGEFVVRFFGQYDHYWVNRGRVFPFQEGDSGKVSSQKSKIDAAFTMAMEHAQRACKILKIAQPNDEESLDIASSLLPPHYVKLRVNKPCGALCGRRIDEESSLTQCECSPDDDLPCGPYSHCLNRMLLTECGPTCRAGDRCNNRAFEKRLYPKLVPYRTPYRGWGLKTLEDIKAGQFVIEYVGELIDEEEFQRRMRRKHEIRDENFYFLTLDKERMIDAGPKGNLARFMNHCCEPNCETQKWTVLGDVRVGLFALYDIPANSEVTFNYNLESAGIEKKRCLCGAKRCSGYIGAKPKQTEQPKKPKRPYNKKRKIDDSPSTSKIKPRLKLGRPPKPKELTEIEKDLLIIKNATNGISSDSDCSGRLSSIESIKDLKASRRKRTIQSTDELSSNSSSPSTKKIKLSEEKTEVCDSPV